MHVRHDGGASVHLKQVALWCYGGNYSLLLLLPHTLLRTTHTGWCPVRLKTVQKPCTVSKCVRTIPRRNTPSGEKKKGTSLPLRKNVGTHPHRRRTFNHFAVCGAMFGTLEGRWLLDYSITTALCHSLLFLVSVFLLFPSATVTAQCSAHQCINPWYASWVATQLQELLPTPVDSKVCQPLILVYLLN